MKYYIFTYDGSVNPIALKLIQEGNIVHITQIEDRKILEVDSGFNPEESKEVKKRRTSLFDGMLYKTPFNDMMNMMRSEENKDDCFVIFEHSNLYNVVSKVLNMGYKHGIFPIKEDFDREMDRNASKEFIKKYAKGLKVSETQEFNKIEDGINYINENSDKQFALKSSGNHAITIVPLTDNNDFAKNELIYSLKKNKQAYEKGFTLEEKIKDPIEAAAGMVFWNGEPLYSILDMETRMIGPGDVGFQTGGNQNIMLATDMNDKINKIAIPPIVYEIAKKRKGLFIFDVGILFDKKGVPYFTEFAGNRWGWGGVFSEMAMSTKDDGRSASNYFESVMKGKKPQQFKFGSALSVYGLLQDGEHAGLYKHGDPIQWDDVGNKFFYPYNVKKEMTESVSPDGKKERNEMHMTVGSNNMESLLGYASGYGNTFEETVNNLYNNFIGHVYTSNMYFRSKADMLATDYPTSLKNRLNFLSKHGYISGKFNIQEDSSVINIYSNYISKNLKY